MYAFTENETDHKQTHTHTHDQLLSDACALRSQYDQAIVFNVIFFFY